MNFQVVHVYWIMIFWILQRLMGLNFHLYIKYQVFVIILIGDISLNNKAMLSQWRLLVSVYKALSTFLTAHDFLNFQREIQQQKKSRSNSKNLPHRLLLWICFYRASKGTWWWKIYFNAFAFSYRSIGFPDSQKHWHDFSSSHFILCLSPALRSLTKFLRGTQNSC